MLMKIHPKCYGRYDTYKLGFVVAVTFQTQVCIRISISCKY